MTSSALTRGEFLEFSTLAAALGLAPAVAGAQAEKRRGHVVVITHGPSDPHRVMLGLLVASRLPEGENHVWFSIDGGILCKKGEAEKVSSPMFPKQGTAADLLAAIRGKGTSVHI
jgi:predicted peroxiredoxin